MNINMHRRTNSTLFLLLYMALCITATALLNSGYQSNYFPGSEDIAIISQSQMHSFFDWIEIGYYDWFDSNYDYTTQPMYEKRPLTHFYTYLISFFIPDDLGDFFYVQLFMTFSVFLAFFSSYLLTHFMGMGKIASLFVGMVFIFFNPSLTFELFTDAAFIQVSLVILVFSLIGVCLLRREYFYLLVLLFTASILKESTFYFGVMSAVIWHFYNDRDKLRSALILLTYYTPFVLIHLNFDHAELDSAIVALQNSNSLYEKVWLSVTTIIKSLTTYPSTIFFGNIDQSWALSVLFIIINSTIVIAVTLFLIIRNPNRNHKIIGMMFAFSLASFLLFNSEIRWGWEYSLVLSIVSVILLTSSSFLHKICGLILISSWGFYGAENSYKIYTIGNYDLGGKKHEIIYRPYLDIMKDIESEQIGIMYVVNDPTEVNAKYLNYFVKTDLNIIRVTEISLKNKGIESETKHEFLNQKLTINTYVTKRSAVIERVLVSANELSGKNLNGVSYLVKEEGDLIRFNIEAFPASSFAVVVFHPENLTYSLTKYITIDNKTVKRKTEYYTLSKRSDYSYSKEITLPCDIFKSYILNSKERIVVSQHSGGAFGLEIESIILKVSGSRHGCNIDFDGDQIEKHGIQAISIMSKDKNDVIEMMRFKY